MCANAPKILPPSSDIVFKMLFGAPQNRDLLLPFLRAVLPLPGDDYDELTLLNPFVRNEVPQKESVLDIQVKTKNEKLINIEIQIANQPHFRERIVYYLTKLIAGQLKEGEEYDRLKPVIGLVITGFKLFSDSLDYHDSYPLRSPKTGRTFSDLLRIDTLELPKLPELSQEDGPRVEWLRFLNAKDKTEMDMLAERNPDIKKAVVRLARLSASEKAQMRYESRLKWQRDMMAQKRGEREEGRAEGVREVARNLLSIGRPIDEIRSVTGLSADEIAALIL
jgi:predicted transposase/invertase (TIGR01784 family)